MESLKKNLLACGWTVLLTAVTYIVCYVLSAIDGKPLDKASFAIILAAMAIYEHFSDKFSNKD